MFMARSLKSNASILNKGIKTDEIKVNERVDPPSTRCPRTGAPDLVNPSRMFEALQLCVELELRHRDEMLALEQIQIVDRIFHLCR
jgi:hypothetical protein